MLSATEIRRVRRIEARAKAGDRAGIIAECRTLLASISRTRDPFRASGQLVLAFVVVKCDTLSADVPAHVCVARQEATDAQRTTQLSRGQGTDYPHCDSRKCDQGRAVRDALASGGHVAWRGRGPGGRFDKGSKGWGEQLAAKARQERAGLLEPVRVLDIDADPSEER